MSRSFVWSSRGDWAFGRSFTKNLFRQCRVCFETEKFKSPLFRGTVGSVTSNGFRAVISNDWCIFFFICLASDSKRPVQEG